MAKRRSTLPRDYDRIADKHSLRAGNEMIVGPYATYEEAQQARAELFPNGRHPKSGTYIDVFYPPTWEQLRRLERENRAINAYHVTYWQVDEDRVIEDGRRLIGAPLSPMFSTRQRCRRAYAEVKGKNPKAYRMQGTFRFYWGDPRDIATRESMISKIRRTVA